MILMQAPAWYITWRSRFAPIRWRWTRVMLLIDGSLAAIVLVACIGLKFFPSVAPSTPPMSTSRSIALDSALSVALILVVLAPLLTMATSGVYLFQEYRWRSRAHSLQGRMCGNCLHDLRGLGDAGKCPECGHPFSLDQLRRYWKGIDIPPTP